MANEASVPTIYNLVCTNSSTWYPLSLLPATKSLSIKARDSNSILQVSFVSDQSTFFTLPSDSAYSEEDVIFPSTIWFLSNTMGTVVEVIGWSLKF